MSQFIGVGLAEFEAPLTHGFKGHSDSALCVVRSSPSRKLSEKRKDSQIA